MFRREGMAYFNICFDFEEAAIFQMPGLYVDSPVVNSNTLLLNSTGCSICIETDLKFCVHFNEEEVRFIDLLPSAPCLCQSVWLRG